MNELFLSALLLLAAPVAPADTMTIGQRIRAAWGLLAKGSLGALEQDFNRIPLDFASGLAGGLKQPYEKSPWVQRAIKLVALPIIEVPLRLSTDEPGGKQILNDTDLTKFWESPALGPDKRRLGLADVIEATVGWLKLEGEAFWILDDTIFASRDTLPFPEAGLTFPRFIVANPGDMKEKTNRADNSLIAWEWSDGQGRRVMLDPKQVIHLRYWNPYNAHRGLAEFAAAAVAAESDYMAGILKRNVMKANGDQGQIIGVKAPLEDAQRKQLEAQLREKRELASRGIFKTIFLGSDFTVADPKVNIVDSSFPLVRLEDRHAVAIAFGVPPSMFEVMASYSVGSASDWYRLIRDTSMPTGKKITEAIEEVIVLQGQQVFAWLDWRQHPVMQQILRELIDPASKLWDRGMSWETISDWLALNLPEFDGRDVAYLPFSATPFGEPRETFSEGEEAEDMEAMSGCPVHGNGHVRRPQAEIRRWRGLMTARRTTTKRFETAFNRELFKARKDTLAKLNALASPVVDGPDRKSGAVADVIFDMAKWVDGLSFVMRNESKLALNTAGTQLLLEIGIDDPWKHPPAKALEYLEKHRILIQTAAKRDGERIREVIIDGFEKGLPTQEVADNIRNEFNDISRGRAKVIAQTETTAAYGEARQEAMSSSGIPFKQWLTSGGPNVRPAHNEANRQVVPVNDPFEVGGYELMGPGDDSLGAPPSITINCFCVAIAVKKETGEIEA